MLDAALDAVITIDSVGRIVEVNAAVEAIFGHRPETLVGRELGEALVPPALRERHRAGLAHGTGKLLGKRVEITALHADGREFPVELTITRIDVPGPPMYTGYVRDITDRIAREQELRASRARIVAAADEARRRLERDLHDGAQNRLLALGLELKVCRRWTRRAALESVREELRLATDELRELARGIHPAVLTELGLIPALRTLVRRAPLPVGLEYDSEERCPAAGRGRRVLPRRRGADQRRPLRERHARRHPRRRARRRAGDRDRRRRRAAAPIRPPAPACAGWRTGWPRSTARCSIDSPPGGGTRVRGVIPCGS